MSATRDGKMWRCQFYYKDWQRHIGVVDLKKGTFIAFEREGYGNLLSPVLGF